MQEQAAIRTTLREKDRVIEEQQTKIEALVQANVKLTASLKVLKQCLAESDLGLLEGEVRERLTGNRDLRTDGGEKERKEKMLKTINCKEFKGEQMDTKKPCDCLTSFDDVVEDGVFFDRLDDVHDVDKSFDKDIGATDVLATKKESSTAQSDCVEGKGRNRTDFSFDGDLITANGVCHISRLQKNRPASFFGNVSIDLDGSDLSARSKLAEKQECNVNSESIQEQVPDILSNIKATSTPTKVVDTPSPRLKGNVDASETHNVLNCSKPTEPSTGPSQLENTGAGGIKSTDGGTLIEGCQAVVITTEKGISVETPKEVVSHISTRGKQVEKSHYNTPDLNGLKLAKCSTPLTKLKPTALRYDLEPVCSPLSRSLPDLSKNTKSSQRPSLDEGPYRDSIKMEKANMKLILRPRDIKKRSKQRSRSHSSADTVMEISKEKQKSSIGKFLTFNF